MTATAPPETPGEKRPPKKSRPRRDAYTSGPLGVHRGTRPPSSGRPAHASPASAPLSTHAQKGPQSVARRSLRATPKTTHPKCHDETLVERIVAHPHPRKSRLHRVARPQDGLARVSLLHDNDPCVARSYSGVCTPARQTPAKEGSKEPSSRHASQTPSRFPSTKTPRDRFVPEGHQRSTRSAPGGSPCERRITRAPCKSHSS